MTNIIKLNNTYIKKELKFVSLKLKYETKIPRSKKRVSIDTLVMN